MSAVSEINRVGIYGIQGGDHMNALVRRSIIYMILSISIVVVLLLVWRIMSHPDREEMPHTEREEIALFKRGGFEATSLLELKDRRVI